MAKITVTPPVKPVITLELSWDEFEAVFSSVAVAEPAKAVGWLCSRNPKTSLTDNRKLNAVTDRLYGELNDVHDKAK